MIAKATNDFKKTEEKYVTKERHLKVIEEKKNRPSEFFYRVSDLGQLKKIGQSYLDDFKTGIKSFAICSTNYKASQQRTVLALASYFDHMFDMKILIISDSPNKGIFEEIMQSKTTGYIPVKGSENPIEVNHFYHHFDLIDLNKLLGLANSNRPNFDFELAMKSINEEYDIIFWDTPIINTYKNNNRIYDHTISYFESLTIIVSPSVSKANDINDLKEHFKSFGVSVKGVLFDTPLMENKG